MTPRVINPLRSAGVPVQAAREDSESQTEGHASEEAQTAPRQTLRGAHRSPEYEGAAKDHHHVPQAHDAEAGAALHEPNHDRMASPRGRHSPPRLPVLQ